MQFSSVSQLKTGRKIWFSQENCTYRCFAPFSHFQKSRRLFFPLFSIGEDTQFHFHTLLAVSQFSWQPAYKPILRSDLWVCDALTIDCFPKRVGFDLFCSRILWFHCMNACLFHRKLYFVFTSWTNTLYFVMAGTISICLLSVLISSRFYYNFNSSFRSR